MQLFQEILNQNNCRIALIVLFIVPLIFCKVPFNVGVESSLDHGQMEPSSELAGVCEQGEPTRIAEDGYQTPQQQLHGNLSAVFSDEIFQVSFLYVFTASASAVAEGCNS